VAFLVRRRRLAGAFFAAAFLVRRLVVRFFVAFFAAAFLVRRLVTRFLAAFFAAVLRVRRFAALARPAFFAAVLRVRRFAALARPPFFAAAFLVVRRFVVLRAAVVLFLATRRFAGLRVAVAFFVRLFAGGTITTFLEGCSGVGTAGCAYVFTADLKAAPAENFTPFDAAI
jgi:hypothetical protein